MKDPVYHEIYTCLFFALTARAMLKKAAEAIVPVNRSIQLVVVPVSTVLGLFVFAVSSFLAVSVEP